MKLLVMTDTHIRGTTPNRRLDDFKTTLLAKLKEVKEIAINEEIDYILHGGDLFDRPDTAPSVVSDFIKVLKTYPVPIYIVAGNHDVYGHNPQTLPRTMLGILVASGIVKLADEEATFLTKNDIKLQLTGASFNYDIDNNETTAYSIKKSSQADYALHLAHGMLLDRPFFDTGYTLIEDIKTEADITVVGHYHLGFGLKEFNNNYFLNPGALVRTSADTKEINRKPKVAIIELDDNIDITFKTLTTAKPGSDVLDRTEIENMKFRKKKLDNFVREIRAAEDFKTFSIDDILDKLAATEGIDPEVREEAHLRLAEAQERLGEGE